MFNLYEEVILWHHSCLLTYVSQQSHPKESILQSNVISSNHWPYWFSHWKDTPGHPWFTVRGQQWFPTARKESECGLCGWCSGRGGGRLDHRDGAEGTRTTDLKYDRTKVTRYIQIFDGTISFINFRLDPKGLRVQGLTQTIWIEVAPWGSFDLCCTQLPLSCEWVMGWDPVVGFDMPSKSLLGHSILQPYTVSLQ